MQIKIKDITETVRETANAGEIYRYPSGCTAVFEDLSEHDFMRVSALLCSLKHLLEEGVLDVYTITLEKVPGS